MNSWAEFCKRAYKGRVDYSRTLMSRVSFGELPVKRKEYERF